MRFRLTITALLATTICIAQNNSGQCFCVDKTVLELEKVIAGGTAAEGEFILTNDGDCDLFILDAQANCRCTEVDWTKGAIKPGNSGKISVKYTHNEHPGHFDKSILVRLSCTETPLLLKVRGEAFGSEDLKHELKTRIPNAYRPWSSPLRIRTSAFNCGDMTAADNPTMVFTVYNSCRHNEVLHLDEMENNLEVCTDSGDNNSENAISGENKSQSMTVPGKGTVTIYVRIVPGISSGHQEYRMKASATRKRLSGRRNHAIELTFSLNLVPPAGTPLPSLDIKDKIVKIGKDGETGVTFGNKGCTDLKIKGIKTSSAHIHVCTVDKTLLPGESSTLKIRASRRRFIRKPQSVTILTNDPSHPEYKIIVTASKDN